MDIQPVSRRDFLTTSGLTGLALGFYTSTHAEAAEISKVAEADNFGVEMKAWIHIDPFGKVIISSYGELMADVTKLETPKDVVLKKWSDYKLTCLIHPPVWTGG